MLLIHKRLSLRLKKLCYYECTMGTSRASRNVIYKAMGKTKYIAGKVGRALKDRIGSGYSKRLLEQHNAEQAHIRKDRQAADKAQYLKVK